MTFTDFTYYKGDINIPFDNLNSVDFQNNYTTPYEEDILVKILGRDLYNNFIAGLAEDTPAQKWLNLRDGAEYTIEYNNVDYTVKWEGLKNSKKVSLLSYYIYTKWVEDNYTQLTSLGNSIAKKENAKSVDVRPNLVNAYNKCADLVGKYPTKLNRILAGDIIESCLDRFEPTIFNFLYYNNSDYPNWIFTHPDIYGRNLFGI